MSTVMDLGKIRASVLNEDPYQYAVLRGSFTTGDIAQRLSREFPSSDFSFSERVDRGPETSKRYRTYDYQLILRGERDERRIAALTPLWQQLVAEVASPGYRAAVAELTGCDLSNTEVEARLTRYSPGCWIEPHTDRRDKVVTHLWYFNEGWQADWLGEFRVLRSAAMADFADRVFPNLGTSLVMVRSDSSYHGVPPVHAECPDERMTLLVHFAAE